MLQLVLRKLLLHRKLFELPEYSCPFCKGYMTQGSTTGEPTLPISEDNPEVYYMYCPDCGVEFPYIGDISFPGRTSLLRTIWFDPYLDWYSLCNDPQKFNEWVVQCFLAQDCNRELRLKYKQLANKKVDAEHDRDYYEYCGMMYGSLDIKLAREGYVKAEEEFNKVIAEVKQACKQWFKEENNDGL